MTYPTEKPNAGITEAARVPSGHVLNTLAKECFDVARDHGFWADWDDPYTELQDYHMAGLKLALIHSEVSEALEALRVGDDEGFAEELVDVIIRTLDLAHAFQVDLSKVLAEKMERNKERPRKHGKRF